MLAILHFLKIEIRNRYGVENDVRKFQVSTSKVEPVAAFEVYLDDDSSLAPPVASVYVTRCIRHRCTQGGGVNFNLFMAYSFSNKSSYP